MTVDDARVQRMHASAAEALASHMALLEMVFDKAPVGLAVVDRDYRFLRINPVLAAINGLPVADHIGRAAADILPAVWDLIEPLYRRVLSGETLHNIALSGRLTPDAPLSHWLASYYPVMHNGEVAGIGVVVNDVTEVHYYREMLRVRTDLYAMISQTSRAAIEHTSDTALFEDVCRIAVDTGHFRFAWIGVEKDGFVVPVARAGEDRGYLGQLVITRDPDDPRSHGPTGRAFLAGEPIITNDFGNSPDTRPWHDIAEQAGLAASAVFPLTERGRVVAVLSLYAGTTGFFRGELLDTVTKIAPVVSFALDALATRREQERGSRMLTLQDRAIRAVSQGICITDAQQPGNPVIFVSEGFERMTGYTAAEMLGRSWHLVQGADTDPDTITTVRNAVHAGRGCTVELRNYRKDGSAFWNELRIAPVVDADGALTHFVGVQTDVTDRRRLELQVRQSQKMEAVGQLASGIAHDFNNLLTVVDMCSEMLTRALAESDPSHELAVEIQRAGERAGQLTRQLLAFSRRQVVAPRVVDINAVVTDSEKLLRRLISESILLTTILQPELWPVFVDAGQLEQVLVNLAVNARDAMPSGGNLCISTSQVSITDAHAVLAAGDYVTIDVTDSGIGMDDEVQSQLFEPFFTTKSAGHGTGLGLSIVRSIVDQARGYVTVESSPGNGSTFRIYLPRCAPDASSATARSTTDMPRGTETILLAEDDASLRLLGRRMLEQCGYRVLVAADGAEALHYASTAQESIDLLVSDVVMPHLGGRQLAEAVTLVRPGCKVLFVSGYTDDDVLLHGVVHSEVAMLQKPYPMSVLAQKVREVLDS